MIAFEYSSHRKQLLIGQKRERSQLLLSCLFQHPPPPSQKRLIVSLPLKFDCHYIFYWPQLPSMQIGQKKEIHKALLWFLNVLFAYRHWQRGNILARNVKLTTPSVFLLFSLKYNC